MQPQCLLVEQRKVSRIQRVAATILASKPPAAVNRLLRQVRWPKSDPVS
jgi:hypothetical protein